MKSGMRINDCIKSMYGGNRIINIFHGKHVRLRARNQFDVERDKEIIKNSAYDTEIDRLTDSIYLPSSIEARLEDWESGIKTANTWENCSLVIETMAGVAVGGIGIAEADRTNGTFHM